MTEIYPLVRGLASYVLPKEIFTRPGSGGTFSSEYCYSVWLRHLVQLKAAGLINNAADIRNVAEIGPGDSLGVGLSAIYTGSENYYAFDVIKHSDGSKNKKINDDLLGFFTKQMEIPHGTHALRNTKPVLKDYRFPTDIIQHDEGYYRSRHALIETNVSNMDAAKNISYVVPWMGKEQENVANIDLIVSQAVMEHVDDIEFAYAEMYRWLKPGGIISHQVDFKSHEMSKLWDGHFFIKPGMWKILAHGRKYPMNRLPFSSHLKVIEKLGFKVKNIVPFENDSNYAGQPFLVPGVETRPEDYYTSSALIQAVK